jgi:hypothetical protein
MQQLSVNRTNEQLLETLDKADEAIKRLNGEESIVITLPATLIEAQELLAERVNNRTFNGDVVIIAPNNGDYGNGPLRIENVTILDARSFRFETNNGTLHPEFFNINGRLRVEGQATGGNFFFRDCNNVETVLPDSTVNLSVNYYGCNVRIIALSENIMHVLSMNGSRVGFEGQMYHPKAFWDKIISDPMSVFVLGKDSIRQDDDFLKQTFPNVEGVIIDMDGRYDTYARETGLVRCGPFPVGATSDTGFWDLYAVMAAELMRRNIQPSDINFVRLRSEASGGIWHETTGNINRITFNDDGTFTKELNQSTSFAVQPGSFYDFRPEHPSHNENTPYPWDTMFPLCFGISNAIPRYQTSMVIGHRWYLYPAYTVLASGSDAIEILQQMHEPSMFLPSVGTYLEFWLNVNK